MFQKPNGITDVRLGISHWDYVTEDKHNEREEEEKEMETGEEEIRVSFHLRIPMCVPHVL